MGMKIMGFETSVLARRFTIICLLATIFGIGFAALVQNFSKPARAYDIGMVVPCVFEQGLECKAPRN
jgi:hypothetical protein